MDSKKYRFPQVKLILTILFIGILGQVYTQKQISLTILPGEKWYGGAVNEGHFMPFANGYSIDLSADNKGNQSSPFYLSTSGRFIWSDQPFQLSCNNNTLQLSGTGIKVETAGKNLRSAFTTGSAKYFPPSGAMPDSLLILAPQYNTWIELLYNQHQEGILKYAHDIINNGFPPGVLMIDDNWFSYYGDFEFRKDRFSDPGKMISELHRLGFKVMVWVSPFISPDTEVFREINKKHLLIYDNKAIDSLQWANAVEPLITKWWNGYSAQIDLSNPAAISWLTEKLKTLQNKYGIDGFKFDAGDMEFYPGKMLTFQKTNANEMCGLWGNLGLKFPLNEYRAMWKGGGQPLTERLRDKLHNWEDLQKLIPHAGIAGLLGYPFVCPDMIGGGDFSSFIGDQQIDQDLIVRSAQCQALMPMMQFSVAPWRVLDAEHLQAVKDAVLLRKKYTAYIVQLAKQAAVTGIPIVRNMEFEFPGQDFENIKEQFMLGNKYLVAPVVTKSSTKKIWLPKGSWKSGSGMIMKGPAILEIKVGLNELLCYEIMSG